MTGRGMEQRFKKKEGTPFRRGLRIWMRTGSRAMRLEIVRVSFGTAAVPLRQALSPSQRRVGQDASLGCGSAAYSQVQVYCGERHYSPPNP